MSAFLKNLPVKALGGRCLSICGPLPPRFLFGMVKQFCRFGIWSNTQCNTSPVYALHRTRSPTHCIVLGLPVFAKRSQTWTGLLDAERVNRKSKAYSRVEQFTRPAECPTQPWRMIDANRVLNIYFTTKCIQTGSYLMLSFERKQD